MGTNIFNKEYVFLNVDAKSKVEVLKFISKKAKDLNLAEDESLVYEGLMAREEQFTTNLGESIAIPHTKNDAIENPAVVVLKFNEDVVWNEGEDKVKLTISLLMPGKSKENIHLKLLSSLSRKLINKEFKDSLLKSDNVEEISNLINEALGL
ncbi:PTS sugar transporter subunit IIA [Clostridioides difficile]|nr:PTS sugar transporter subunit IIA [Clostridioides difficile]